MGNIVRVPAAFRVENGRECKEMDRVPNGWSLYTGRGERKYLNAEERRRFLAAAWRAAPADRTFCLTVAFTGCRISEALRLVRPDFQAPGAVAILCLKKRGRLVMREVPVPGLLLEEIDRVHGHEGAGDARLWPWGRTRGWRIIKEVMAAAGIDHRAGTPRGLRHGFGVHAVHCGVPLNLVQRWLGHAHIATTAIYANALGPEERAIAGRMW